MTASAVHRDRAHDITGRLYLVATPRASMPDAEFLARIEAALDGGVDVLQLRCKTCETLPYLRLAERVGALARTAGVPFFVNDRVDVALATGADGVHLGLDDLPVEWARRVLPNALVGRSTHDVAHADRAIEESAAYFAVGPVWATPTKPGRPAAGLEYVRAIAERTPAVPWFAIGGISVANAAEVLASGATRLAVVRAVLDAPDPAVAAHALMTVLHEHAASVVPSRREVPACM